MRPKACIRTREIRQVQALLVGSDEPARRGRSDGLAEVRLADSTPRLGKPATWGSGQRKVNCSTETWAPFNGRGSAFYAKRRSASHDNRTRTDSSESLARPKLFLPYRKLQAIAVL